MTQPQCLLALDARQKISLGSHGHDLELAANISASHGKAAVCSWMSAFRGSNVALRWD